MTNPRHIDGKIRKCTEIAEEQQAGVDQHAAASKEEEEEGRPRERRGGAVQEEERRRRQDRERAALPWFSVAISVGQRSVYLFTQPRRNIGGEHFLRRSVVSACCV